MSESTYTLVPIGYVESPLIDLDTAPKQGGEGGVTAALVFDPAVEGGLRDLRVGDEILLVTWLDRAQRETLQVHPRDDLAAPLRGVFSTRSADRPNPIGLHRVRITAKETTLRFQVHPLEVINRTPILDIKPVLAATFES